MLILVKSCRYIHLGKRKLGHLKKNMFTSPQSQDPAEQFLSFSGCFGTGEYPTYTQILSEQFSQKNLMFTPTWDLEKISPKRRISQKPKKTNNTGPSLTIRADQTPPVVDVIPSPFFHPTCFFTPVGIQRKTYVAFVAKP